MQEAADKRRQYMESNKKKLEQYRAQKAIQKAESPRNEGSPKREGSCSKENCYDKAGGKEYSPNHSPS